MTIRFRKIANGLAAHQVVHEQAVVDYGYFHCPDALVIRVVAADQSLARESFQGGVILHGQKDRKDAALVIRGVVPGGPRGLSRAGPLAENVAADHTIKDV